MSKVVLSFAASILVMFFGIINFGAAQKSALANKNSDLAAMPLENVQIEAQSIGGLLSDLSLSYDIPIGLEIALNDNELLTYNLDFKKGKLSDLLTQFVTEHDQYAWEIKDGVVNVFPKASYRDLLFHELLDTTISKFSIKEETSCWALAKSLVTAPEIKKVLAAKGESYRARSFSGVIPQVGKNFTLELSNTTLKSILNNVIKESPTAKFWLMTRNSYDQTLYVGINARHEDIPMKDGKPNFLQ
jgi:hypothetical protein